MKEEDDDEAESHRIESNRIGVELFDKSELL